MDYTIKNEGEMHNKNYFVFLLDSDGIILHKPLDDISMIVVHGFVKQWRAGWIFRDSQFLLRLL